MKRSKFDFLYTASQSEHMEKEYIKTLKDSKTPNKIATENKTEYQDDATLAFSNREPLFLIHIYTLLAAMLCIAQDCVLYSKTLTDFQVYSHVKKFQSEDGKQFGTEQDDTTTLQRKRKGLKSFQICVGENISRPQTPLA